MLHVAMGQSILSQANEEDGADRQGPRKDATQQASWTLSSKRSPVVLQTNPYIEPKYEENAIGKKKLSKQW